MWYSNTCQVMACCLHVLHSLINAVAYEHRASSITDGRRPSTFSGDDGDVNIVHGLRHRDRRRGPSDVSPLRSPGPGSPAAGGIVDDPPPRLCLSNAACDQANGEQCMRLYDGCTRGWCAAVPTSSILVDDLCPSCCLDGRCRCDITSSSDALQTTTGIGGGIHWRRKMAQHVGMTPCVTPSHRFIGQTCSPASKHVCIQNTGHGYTKTDVWCSTEGICSCVDGFKNESQSCLKWKVNEYGCILSHHCEGGAICVDRRCRCPSGYYVPPGYSKCIRREAMTGLGKGEVCDEVYERSYCANGLVCYRCDRETVFKCVRFLFNEVSVISNSCRQQFDTSTTLLSLAAVALFVALSPTSLLQQNVLVRACVGF